MKTIKEVREMFLEKGNKMTKEELEEVDYQLSVLESLSSKLIFNQTKLLTIRYYPSKADDRRNEKVLEWMKNEGVKTRVF